MRAGTAIEVYLDHRGAIDGWRRPGTEPAINQRHLAPDGAEPVTATPLACQGPCGLVWQAPAAPQVIDHGEGCLTCAGALAVAWSRVSAFWPSAAGRRHQRHRRAAFELLRSDPRHAKTHLLGPDLAVEHFMLELPPTGAPTS